MNKYHKINEEQLLGYAGSDWRIGFKWLNRYSETNITDDKGRWARKCFYNGICIAWVTGMSSEWKNAENTKKDGVVVDMYSVTLFFPTTSNDSPCEHIFKSSLPEAMQYVEDMFISFKSHITKL